MELDDLSDSNNGHPVRKRLRQKKNIGKEEEEDEDDFSMADKLEEYEDDDDVLLKDFIVPDDDIPDLYEQKLIRRQELRDSVIDECPFPIEKAKTSSLPIPPMKTIPFVIPIEIIDGPPEDAIRYAETDNVLKEEFMELKQMPRYMWSESKFYKRFFESIVVGASRMGRASNHDKNYHMLQLIMQNRVKFSDMVIMNIDDRCDGCMIAHKTLTHIFHTLNVLGDTDTVLKMGSICGEKLKSLVELYRILNSLSFISSKRKDWVTNAQTMFNYWCSYIMGLIATNEKD